jgi:hypothetical protein
MLALSKLASNASLLSRCLDVLASHTPCASMLRVACRQRAAQQTVTTKGSQLVHYHCVNRNGHMHACM